MTRPDERLNKRCTDVHNGKTRTGAVQRPLFHDLQRMVDEEEPGGSGDSFEEGSEEPRTDEPAAWKLNS